MLRNVNPKTKKPVMVMLHGSGSSGAIFSIQAHLLAKELSKTFDLVFLDAPIPSEPGPGVLPLFADMPDYYRWLAPANIQLSGTQRLVELFDAARHIQSRLDAQNVSPDQITAMLGFSQGALIALAMLGFRLIGQSIWANLRFCVAIGVGTTGNTFQMEGVQHMVGMLSAILGQADGKFPGYTVNAMGLQDLWYKDGKRIAEMCVPERTRVIDYHDGHVVPRHPVEVKKLMKAIQQIDEASRSSLNTMQHSMVESMPSLLAGGDISEGLAVLAANGILIQQ
ncbi:serine hydrolase-domain-containing protein [Aspergillus alliaceus]|uniref:serine hydrolase-domain-containing protein n=1 Tax=Petromyces alliaceus TaxID=209559 RepID=UPI0012A76D6E|nr:serine hydrolase-domain-containing protein [Aspergillus alliaceus]KAB8238385.1 serine hydrolase-domain-containing protein [Aspergillus alliaceus]